MPAPAPACCSQAVLNLAPRQFARSRRSAPTFDRPAERATRRCGVTERRRELRGRAPAAAASGGGSGAAPTEGHEHRFVAEEDPRYRRWGHHVGRGRPLVRPRCAPVHLPCTVAAFVRLLAVVILAAPVLPTLLLLPTLLRPSSVRSRVQQHSPSWLVCARLQGRLLCTACLGGAAGVCAVHRAGGGSGGPVCGGAACGSRGRRSR